MPVEIVAQARAEDPQRCWCLECRQLDRRFPNRGYQLTLFPFNIAERWLADALDRKKGRPE